MIAIALPVLIMSAIEAGSPSGIVTTEPLESLNTQMPTAAPSRWSAAPGSGRSWFIIRQTAC